MGDKPTTPAADAKVPMVDAAQIKRYAADVFTYQLIDSLRKKEISLDHIVDNAVALAIYRWVLHPSISGGTLKDLAMSYDAVEDYLIRLLSLYLSKSLLRGNLGSAEALMKEMKDQVFYQLGVEFRVRILGNLEKLTDLKVRSATAVAARQYL